MPGRKPKNTWVLLVSGVAALVLVAGVVSIDSLDLPINALVRGAALLGYLMVFLSAVSSNYMRELTRFFGRPFPTVHHVVTVTALVALATHATSVAWRSGTPAVFLPQFSSFYAFFSLGGRMAFWLIAVTSLTALFRAGIGKNWKVIHWLNYVALILGTIHCPDYRSKHPALGSSRLSCLNGYGSGRRLCSEATPCEWIRRAKRARA